LLALIVIIWLFSNHIFPNQPLDVTSTSYVIENAYLEAMLENGAQLRHGSKTIELRLFRRSAVILPTGRLVVTDPFPVPDASAFSLQVAPGYYPIIISQAYDITTNRLEFYAAASICFTDYKPVTWYLAVPPGQDPTGVEERELVGQPVDSGAIAFMSLEGAEAFRRQMFLWGIFSEGRFSNTHNFYSGMKDLKKVNSPGDFAYSRINDETDMFIFGTDDGVKVSYWGYDQNGQIACLLTDLSGFSIDSD
jgi:hypothetical protein